MVTMNFILFLLIIPSFLLMIFVVENKTRMMLIFMAFGIFAGFLSGQVNAIISAYSKVPGFELSIHVAPVVEELIKAFPLVLFFFVFKPDKRYLLGCAVGTGLGFAFFENVLAFTQEVSYTPTWHDVSFALSRGFGAGMIHSVCTMIFIYGIYLCSKRKKLMVTGTLAVFSFVCTLHSLFNVLIQSQYTFAPFVLTIGVYLIILYISIKKRKTN